MQAGTTATVNSFFPSKNLQPCGPPDYISLITANLHLRINKSMRFNVLGIVNIDGGVPGN